MRVFGVFVCLLLAAGLAPGGEGEARQRFKQAQKAERAGDLVRAYKLYTEAVALDPTNTSYWVRSRMLQTKALELSRSKLRGLGMMRLSEPAAETEPGSPPSAAITSAELAEARRPLPPLELIASGRRCSFDIRGDGRQLFQQVAREFGLEAVFPPDYQPGPPIRFRLDDAGYREALHALESATRTFVIPVRDKTFLVANDTPQNRAELEPNASITVPVPEPVSVQEAQELVRAVQQVMNLTRFVLDSQQRLVLMKDRVSKLRPAMLLFDQLLRHKAQVSIELEFMEAGDTGSTGYGLSLQTLFPIVNFGDFWNSKPAIPSGFTKFAVFGGGATFLGLGVTDGRAFVRMDRSRTKTLLRTEIRSLDGQAASLHVGERFPIVTSAFLGQIQGETSSIPPAFNFEDLGIMVKITPHVHGDSEISLDVEAEFKVLTGQSLNSIPVIANRKLQSTARLAANEWVVVAGLTSGSRIRTITGPAGLSSLPYLGPLFRETTTDRAVSDVLLVLKPKLLARPPSSGETRPVLIGPEARPLTPL